MADQAGQDPRVAHPELRPLFEAAEKRWKDHWLAGPTRRAWTELPVQAGDRAPDTELLDAGSQPVRLSSTWAERPAVLLFWRHWGCGCGTGRAELLLEQYDRLIEAGGNVVVIGLGDPQRAAWYRETYGLPCPVLVDPDEATFRAFGLLEMSPWILNGAPIMSSRELDATILRHRRRGRPVADNPFLLPGEFVVDRLGRLVLTYRYQYCDNYPDVETLVDSIHEASAAR
jgi:peroxiredoxin